MTLLELLVVVAILAVLATVAIQTTSDIGEQTRYEATRKTVDGFRGAVLGPQGQVAPDGSSVISGFVADMGRLPVASSIFNPELQEQGGLVELYSETLPAGVNRYSLQLVSDTTTIVRGLAANSQHIKEATFSGSLASGFIRVPVGWRGPYLRKPTSSYTLVDGWEKPIVSRWEMGRATVDIPKWPTMLLGFGTSSDSFVYGPGNAYTAVLSPGRQVSGVYCNSGFDGGISSGAYSGGFVSLISMNEVQNDIVVQVTAPSGKYSTTSGFTVLLFSYGPNPVLGEKPVQVYGQSSPFTSAQTSFALTSTNAPTIGHRVFRASLKTNSVANSETTNYVHGQPIVVPITRYTQSINIPLP